jgi:hypothetical protein
MQTFDKKTPEAKQGVYRKYYVKRLRDRAKKHVNCEYFVLDLRHDPHSKAALIAYAKSCKKDFPELASDLLEKVGTK